MRLPIPSPRREDRPGRPESVAALRLERERASEGEMGGARGTLPRIRPAARDTARDMGHRAGRGRGSGVGAKLGKAHRNWLAMAEKRSSYPAIRRRRSRSRAVRETNRGRSGRPIRCSAGRRRCESRARTASTPTQPKSQEERIESDPPRRQRPDARVAGQRGGQKEQRSAGRHGDRSQDSCEGENAQSPDGAASQRRERAQPAIVQKNRSSPTPRPTRTGARCG